ncbi:transcriptional antiterminator RfaH [Pseudomonas citronellolis]|uniref:transcription/translation regulatory transformer protein RfaH n=1 Tax=Pseudomonas citronellolis TaxID=53408 RepID=UPI00209DCBCC|nr:transcription/translation regulatory transformer protein RfaH [Pseudomonas citronellolis]MCP1641864.1 transcriptional antiterminator RfaH [Pseudomonas citronellolis]MCP1664782.1 transcriptional antiterminator RfaH [Pseudomonas citronellolis]MCP1695759.1 transcriptional antiterminator RfaH [Pseudomonas citronellolis]MCP1702618.1 transcriptional antiterminator RfaH [Pseudomonas citronellolis]MCP1796503.1 transcriptional antiterminator RfaH [Pseudomonas citronellolis]
MPDATGKRWYLVQCKPRQSPRALEHLERQGYQCLLPLHEIERLREGQLQKLSEPLFPGYLFIYLDKVEDNWLPIRSTRGVNNIVSFGGQPTRVPEYVIQGLRKKAVITRQSTLSEGDLVLINEPGLDQIEAVLLEKNSDIRVTLLLKILQREVTIKIPLSRLKKHSQLQ